MAQAQQIPGRYIVELSTPPVAEYETAPSSGKISPEKFSIRSTAAVSHRARIRTEQAAVRSNLASRNITVLDSVDTVANALFVQADDPAVLRSIPGVARVYPVRRVKLLLDRAVGLHRVTDAWNQIGLNRAGSGVKIAIIDTGIDNNHAGFRNSTLTAPAGFPRTGTDTDLAYTNGKVIVARSYVSLLGRADPDMSARDRVGHGTALAMIAAGVRTTAPLATLTGVAPQAWLGNYKVFGTPGSNDGSTDDAIIKAIDDAVSDGMDIISLSIGTDTAPRLADDPEVAAVERAVRAGVIVVAAAGNNGPDLNTFSSPATATSVIAVGATTNDRTFGTSVQLSGLASTLAFNGSGTPASGQVSGAAVDVASLDGTGEGCSALPDGSLSNRIALVRRGTCTFEAKLNNAQRAGAIAAVVTARADAPDPFIMSVGAATLPAQMISYDAGEAIRSAVATDANRSLSMHFTSSPVDIKPNLLAGFSSTGPNVDLSIKPDIMAVGTNFYTATQSFDPDGDMYSGNGFILVSGTSFSTPFAAGVAALLKSARPGLTVDQYRSLLINTGRAMVSSEGRDIGIQRSGAGLLDASAAVRATAVLAPVSLSFGSGRADATFARSFSVTNLSGSDETYSVTVDPRSCASAPGVERDTITVGAGLTSTVAVNWSPSGLATGACEGTFNVTGMTSGTSLRLPWWYAVATNEPFALTTLDITDTGRRGGIVRDAVLFRITDAAGLPITEITPDVAVISGGAEVTAVSRYDSDIPGMFGIDLRLGALAGTNTIEIRAGGVSKRFDITGR